MSEHPHRREPANRFLVDLLKNFVRSFSRPDSRRRGIGLGECLSVQSNGRHAATTELGSRCSQRFPARLARRSIQGQTVMPNGGKVCLPVSSDAFVFGSSSPVLAARRVSFACPSTFGSNEPEFGFIQHGHFRLASPTPKQFHVLHSTARGGVRILVANQLRLSWSTLHFGARWGPQWMLAYSLLSRVGGAYNARDRGQVGNSKLGLWGNKVREKYAIAIDADPDVRDLLAGQCARSHAKIRDRVVAQQSSTAGRYLLK